jgi:hypothetical protein
MGAAASTGPGRRAAAGAARLAVIACSDRLAVTEEGGCEAEVTASTGSCREA